MSAYGDGSACDKGKSKGKGKLGAPPPPPPQRVAGPPKSTTASCGLKLKTTDPSKVKGPSRLHMTAAQQLLDTQELDGHFAAKAFAIKLDKLWTKLMVSAPPCDDSQSDFSDDPADATVCMVRLFELFAEKSGSGDGCKRERIVSWFGSSGLLGDRWLHEAVAWLSTHRSDWRESRLPSMQAIIEKWFATDGDCTLPASFVDNKQLQERHAEISEKFASSQIDSLRREGQWAANQPMSDISAVAWEGATAVRWCFGGGGGCYLVRIGDEKLIVKGCQHEGDALAHEVASLMEIRVASIRFVSAASTEFEVAHRALASAEPDEPDHRRKLLVQFEQLKKTGAPLMVMEFVPGDSLQGRLGSEALNRGDAQFMQHLGKILTMDLLMNNWDRMPALRSWPSAGNFGNVLVTHDGGVVAIDQAFELLCDPQKRLDYYHALRSFVVDISDGEGQHSESIKRIRAAVRSQIMKWTGDVERDAEIYQQFMTKPDSVQGIVLEDSACCLFANGVCDALSKISKLRAAFVSEKQVLTTRIRAHFVEMEGEHHFERIDASLRFVEECMRIVESDEMYNDIVQNTLKEQAVFPSRKFFSTLQCRPQIDEGDVSRARTEDKVMR